MLPMHNTQKTNTGFPIFLKMINSGLQKLPIKHSVTFCTNWELYWVTLDCTGARLVLSSFHSTFHSLGVKCGPTSPTLGQPLTFFKHSVSGGFSRIRSNSCHVGRKRLTQLLLICFLVTHCEITNILLWNSYDGKTCCRSPSNANW